MQTIARTTSVQSGLKIYIYNLENNLNTKLKKKIPLKGLSTYQEKPINQKLII